MPHPAGLTGKMRRWRKVVFPAHLFEWAFLCLLIFNDDNMAKKKTSGIRKCIARGCGAKISRATAKYAKQYCEEHYQVMQQLRRLRQPCSIIGCKNPAHEDGYCDGCRPFDSVDVPFRMDWIDGDNKLISNRPKCLYTGRKPESLSYRINSIHREITDIVKFLKG